MWSITNNAPFNIPEGVYPHPCVRYPGIVFDVPERFPIYNWNAGTCKECHAVALIQPRGLCYMCSREDYDQGMSPGTWVETGLPRVHRKPNVLDSGMIAVGYTFPNEPMVMTASTEGAEATSAKERQNSSVPPPSKALWKELREFARFARGEWSDLFGVLPRYHSFKEGFTADGRPMTFDEWNSHFPLARREQHKREYEKHLHLLATDAEYVKWCKVAMFVKREKLNKCGRRYAPRTICPFEPKVTAFTGPQITVFQNWLHAWWNGINVPVLFAAGCPPEKLSKFFDEQFALGRQCFTTDMSIYDSTVGRPCHKLGMDLYEAIGFELDPHFLGVRKAQGGPLKGYGVCGTRFQTTHSMKSGQADTCLLNSIVNAVVHLFAIAKVNAFDLKTTLKKVAMMIMGDDNMGFVDADVKLTGVKDVLFRLGFIPKFNIERDPEQAVFLNMLPYPVGNEHFFAPTAERLFARLGWATERQGDTRAYLCAVGKGFHKSCRHVPVLRALVDRYIAMGRRVDGVNHDRGLEKTETFARKHLGFKMSLTGFDTGETREAQANTRTYMCARYGWTEADIDDLETKIRAWPDPPAMIGEVRLAALVAGAA